MKLSIIIPAYNEEQRISQTLTDYLKFYQENTEILVVLNGCTDKTAEVVSNFQKQYPNILQLINIKEPIGKGGAVQQGFLKAKGEIIGFIDADNAIEPTEFNKLFSCVDHADGAIASRWLPESVIIDRPWIRTQTSKIFTIIVKNIFQMPFSDTQCGAKVFKREKIINFISKLTEKGMAFDVELLYLCFLKKLQIKEIPIKWISKPGSAALGNPFKAIRVGFQMIKKLFKIKKYGETSNF